MAAFLDLFRAKKEVSHLSPHAKTEEVSSVSEEVLREIRSDGAPRVRVVFMGTPEFAASLLSRLIEKGYNIVCVITKPDTPAGRKQEVIGSAVKNKALEHGLTIEQPKKLDLQAIEKIKGFEPDMIIVAAYGKILPKEILEIPGFGCINVHASLLPKWRGASPIQNALLDGATVTGTTIMLMDEGMDTGALLAQKKLTIDPHDTKESLLLRLIDISGDLLLETLPRWINRTIPAVPQDNEDATLCQLIEREDGHIIWTDDAADIYNRYRALSPWPGIFSFWNKDGERLRLKFHRISYHKGSSLVSHPIGQVFQMGEKTAIQTGLGVIFLEEVQLEGKTRIPIETFMLGNKDIIGSFLQ